MAEIKLRSKQSDQAITILREALKTEEMRLGHSLDIAQRRMNRFEEQYGITSDKFIDQGAAEDLQGGDVEYVEWSGEFRLASRLQERLSILKSIEL